MWMLDLANFLHFVGLAFGLGGATIAALISSKADKDSYIASAFSKIMPSIVKLIWVGLVLLTISGIILTIYAVYPLDKQMLLVKHVFIAWIVIFGILIGSNSRKMQISLPIDKGKPSDRFLKAKNKVKIFSMINLILWYVVTLLSVFV